MASNLKNHKYAASPDADPHVADCTGSMPECVTSQVNEKPIGSIAVAVGAGIGVGLFLTAMFSSERTGRERLADQVSRYLQSGLGSVGNAIPNTIADRFR